MKRFCVFGILNIISAAILIALPKVAVLDAVLAGEMDQNLSLAVTETISMEFVNSGNFTVLDRSTVKQSMKEFEFQLSGLVNEDEMQRAGELIGSRLGADYVVIAQVIKITDTFFISAKFIDIKSGEIISQSTAQARGAIGEILRASEDIGGKISARIEIVPWNDLIGSWLVTRRPEGWGDFQYVFQKDGGFEIYHNGSQASNLHYLGNILNVDQNTISVTAMFRNGEAFNEMMVMDYKLLSDSSLQIGWGGIFYLELSRKR